MKDFFSEAVSILLSHGFTAGYTINTKNWFIFGSQEIRLMDGGFIHLITRGGVFIQRHYKKDARLLENVIFYSGLNKEGVKRMHSKYADIKIHKMEI